MLQWMSEQERPPTEEELREMYEQELKRVRVEDVLVQTIVSLINLGGRKAGVAPGTEGERDPEQVRKAIEAVKALLPQVEELLGPDLPKIRDALSQLQMAYAQAAGGPGEPQQPQEPAAEEPQKPEGPGPAQSSGKLWVPGQ
jgi:hypothetical protein